MHDGRWCGTDRRRRRADACALVARPMASGPCHGRMGTDGACMVELGAPRARNRSVRTVFRHALSHQRRTGTLASRPLACATPDAEHFSGSSFPSGWGMCLGRRCARLVAVGPYADHPSGACGTHGRGGHGCGRHAPVDRVVQAGAAVGDSAGNTRPLGMRSLGAIAMEREPSRGTGRRCDAGGADV